MEIIHECPTLIWYNMIGRPNLERYQCRRFQVVFHLDIPDDLSAMALEGSFNYKDRLGLNSSIYGKAYQANQTPYAVDGLIRKLDGQEHHLSFTISRIGGAKPPPEIQNPDGLLSLAADIASGDPVAITMNGTFAYSPDLRWESLIGLPFELPEPFSPRRGMVFTHLDGVRYVNLEDDVVKDSIEIGIGGDGDILHYVRLNRAGIIDRRLMGGLLREGARISSGFVNQEKDASDAD